MTKYTKYYTGIITLSLITAFGVILLATTYVLAYNGRFYNHLFWTSVLLFSIPIFMIIYDDKTSRNSKVIALFIFGSVLYIMRILPSTANFRFVDELFHYETTKLIYEVGSLNISPHFDISKYYYGIELLNISFGYIVNISNIFLSSKILIWAVHSFIIVFIYILFKDICTSERIAFIGAFIYATNPLYIFFESLYSYESLGIFFVVFIIYILSKNIRVGSTVLSTITIVALSVLTFTHHLSSLMLLLFMIILVSVIFFHEDGAIYHQKLFLRFIFLTMTFIFGWMTYVAVTIPSYLFRNFTDRFSKVFELSLFGGENKDLFHSSLSYSLLPNYEYMIDTFIYVPLLLLLSLIGIYYIKKNKYNNNFIYTTVIYGPIFYMCSLVLIPTSGSELAQRSWGFLYIGLSLVISIALISMKTSEKRIVHAFIFTSIVIIIIGGVSIGNKPVHREPGLLSPKLVGGSGGMTTDVYKSSEWFETRFGRHNNVTGDRTTIGIFRNYGIQNADLWNSWRVFLPKNIDTTVTAYLKYSDISYIIVDNRMTISLGDVGYYFNNIDRYKRYYPIYGSSETLPKESIGKFNNNNLFDKFYDNGNIVIYDVKNYEIDI